MDEFAGISLGDRRAEAVPVRVLLVTPDRRTAALIAEMLQASWSDGLVVAHARTLSDATHELLDHPVGGVLLDAADGARSAPPRSSRSGPPRPTCRSWCWPTQGDEDEAVAAVQAGAQDYLVKSPTCPRRCSGARCVTRSSASARRPSSPTGRCTTRSPGCPTGRCSSTASGSRSTARAATTPRSRSCSSTSTTSRRSTTRSGHAAGDRLLSGAGGPAADRCCARWTRSPGSAATSSRSCSRSSTGEREVVLIAERICRAVTRCRSTSRRRHHGRRSASGSRSSPTRRSLPTR